MSRPPNDADDRDIHAIIGELIDLPPEQRQRRAEVLIPSDLALRGRILRAVGIVIPQQIGRYRIRREIGGGGMGNVYLAHDAKLGRDVAVKVIRSGLDSPELRERFSREAQSSARLGHRGIVTVHDVGEHEGRPFIVMEYVRGRTLFELIKARDECPLPRKLEMLEEVCDALHWAHQAGIIHRDVKPSNIMIDDAGVVKVLDFGIARINTPQWGPALTEVGGVIGTDGYLPPEVRRGETIDALGDMFATAAVAYELLSMTMSFGEDRGFVKQVARGELPKIVGVPPPVEPIVHKGLAPEPRDRFADMAAMAAAFREARLGIQASPSAGESRAPVGSTPPGAIRPDRRVLVASLLVLLAVGGAGLAWRLSGSRVHGIGSANLTSEQLAAARNDVASPALEMSSPRQPAAASPSALSEAVTTESGRSQSTSQPAPSRLVTPSAPLILGQAAVALGRPLVLVVDAAKTPRREVSDVLARMLSANAGAFLPAFLPNPFTAAFDGDSRELAAVDGIDAIPVILLAVAHTAVADNAFEGLRRATLSMDVRVFRPSAGFTTDMLHVETVGAGFTDADALNNATERAGNELRSRLR